MGKWCVLLIALLSCQAMAANERQTLSALLVEVAYLDEKIAEARKNGFKGQATQGQLHFDYQRLHREVKAWRVGIGRYLKTPAREPLDLNAEK